MVICLERGADLHTAQLMPLPLTVSCFSKIQIGFTFLVPAHQGSPGQKAVKRVLLLLLVTRRRCAQCSDTCCRRSSAISDEALVSFDVNSSICFTYSLDCSCTSASSTSTDTRQQQQLQNAICPVASAESRRRLRSASSADLIVPATRRTTMGAGPRLRRRSTTRLEQSAGRDPSQPIPSHL